MRFGRTLRRSIYEPWSPHYLDYSKLKRLLREPDDDSDGSRADTLNTVRSGEEDQWTDDDESAFVEELVNVQLEKVHAFQTNKSQELRERTSHCESVLEDLVQSVSQGQGDDEGLLHLDSQESLKKIIEELDGITQEINRLENFSRINFTGFLKAAKKHDRKRGLRYRVRPLLQVRLGALPFNAEDYSPLLYRLSAMYSFIRQHLEGSMTRSQSLSDTQPDEPRYTSYKYWVHPDNVMEVKTYILRRLPLLVYTPPSEKVADGAQDDPTITSLYFDSSKFSLYEQKIERASNVSSLRLRWCGKLIENPEVLFEKKTMHEGDISEDKRFAIKSKHVQAFIKGEYKMDKSIRKLQAQQGRTSQAAGELQKTVEEIQQFIRENELQPMLRANYTRTAFQIPGDDRIRASIDTNLALIREDSLDAKMLCRVPEEWHRTDIDEAGMVYPFDGVPKGQVSYFPFAVLEIKVREGARKRLSEWMSDLTTSHLVKEAPRFSKFVHGVAVLFEDYVNSFPFWLSEVDQDIRKDPTTAFEEEQEKKAKRAEEEFVVGSYLGSRPSEMRRHVSGSPASGRQGRRSATHERQPKSSLLSETKQAATVQQEEESHVERDEPEETSREQSGTETRGRSTSLLPSFSLSRYGRAHQHGTVQLPPGVRHPGKLIKDSGPVQVEPKVWLANERTFLKWQNISILLATLSLGLYNAAGETNAVARTLGVIYTLIAIFAGVWGWGTYVLRSRLIEQRSGKDFDNIFGPMIVCFALIIALCLNFAFSYHVAEDRPAGRPIINQTMVDIHKPSGNSNLTDALRMVEHQWVAS